MRSQSPLPVEVARHLRQTQTSAEAILWERLRNRQVAGAKFRRQHRVPHSIYVADFFCNESRLVIELDGPIHAQQEDADTLRQQNIEALGYAVLRFKNEQVLTDLNSVIATIAENLTQ